MSIHTSGKLVAARYLDGRVLKGRTTDFLPNRDAFHVAVNGQPQIARVDVAALKALFFIKTEEGNPEHEERKTFQFPSGSWVKLWVVFECDGEELAGWTMSSLSGRTGFFMIPTDQASNIENVFVFQSALRSVLKGADAEAAARDHAQRKTAEGRTARAAVFTGDAPAHDEGHVSMMIDKFLKP